MSFKEAALTIASIGAYGDLELPDDAFNRDDRTQRIHAARSILSDYVFEELCQQRDNFKPEHVSTIAHMIAVGMMAQFNYDLEAECRTTERADKLWSGAHVAEAANEIDPVKEARDRRDYALKQLGEAQDDFYRKCLGEKHPGEDWGYGDMAAAEARRELAIRNFFEADKEWEELNGGGRETA
jgi:hypothetical protein